MEYHNHILDTVDGVIAEQVAVSTKQIVEERAQLAALIDDYTKKSLALDEQKTQWQEQVDERQLQLADLETRIKAGQAKFESFAEAMKQRQQLIEARELQLTAREQSVEARFQAAIGKEQENHLAERKLRGREITLERKLN